MMEEMGRLKRKEYASRSQAMRQDQFAWFLVPALLLLLLALILPDRRRVAPSGQASRADSQKLTQVAVALAAFLALASLPGRAQSVHTLAESARADYVAGRYESALGSYQRALQQASTPSLKFRLHFNIGTCMLALRRSQEAKDELSLALAGAEPLVKRRALYNLAQAFYAGGDRERALASLRALLIDGPDDRDAQLLYEWILRQKPPSQPPPQNPPNPPPQPPPPDVLEQLPMPPPKELQNEMRPPEPPAPGMKPW